MPYSTKSSDRIYAFGCDLNPDSGEGFLANALLSHIQYTHNVVIYEDAIVRLLRSCPLSRDRLLPLYLFFVILGFLAQNKHVVILNYVPIWNFLNAILARLGARLGPVTGSVYILPSKATLSTRISRLHIQRFLINAFLWIYPRKRLIWAATPSVMAQFEGIAIPNAIFGFPVAKHVSVSDYSEKKFDIFIYSGRHQIKNHQAALTAVKMLSAAGYKICYVGPDFVNKHLSVTSFEQLPETLFNRFLGESRLYISFSFEDSGITGMKALAFGVPVLSPSRSGLAFMTMHNNAFCYNDPYELNEIHDKVIYIFEQLSDFSALAISYFEGIRAASSQAIEVWSQDL